MDIVERLRLGDFSPFSGEYIKDADKDEAADEIERLRDALFQIYGWYPISITQPRLTLNEVMAFAKKALEGK